mmetsp:Transcript_42615/g.127877  ORF Transcript_42615/g.127877 Transcript_42615/m.127877 type:complete len:418 (-) Transcript_42615:1910-3163(-)
MLVEAAAKLIEQRRRHRNPTHERLHAVARLLQRVPRQRLLQLLQDLLVLGRNLRACGVNGCIHAPERQRHADGRAEEAARVARQVLQLGALAGLGARILRRGVGHLEHLGRRHALCVLPRVGQRQRLRDGRVLSAAHGARERALQRARRRLLQRHLPAWRHGQRALLAHQRVHRLGQQLAVVERRKHDMLLARAHTEVRQVRHLLAQHHAAKAQGHERAELLVSVGLLDQQQQHAAAVLLGQRVNGVGRQAVHLVQLAHRLTRYEAVPRALASRDAQRFAEQRRQLGQLERDAAARLALSKHRRHVRRHAQRAAQVRRRLGVHAHERVRVLAAQPEHAVERRLGAHRRLLAAARQRARRVPGLQLVLQRQQLLGLELAEPEVAQPRRQRRQRQRPLVVVRLCQRLSAALLLEHVDDA